MSATASTPRPIYLQYEATPPPYRFIAIVEAYLHHLKNAGNRDLSMRHLMEASDVGHGVGSRLLKNWRENDNQRPNVSTVQKVASHINALLDGLDEPKWPIQQAMASAGHDTRFTVMPLAITARRDDDLDRGASYISAPILDIEQIARDGMRHAVRPRDAINFSGDMGVIVGKVPDYPQRPDEMVLFQRPQNLRGIENAWALVRFSEHEVRAVEKNKMTPVMRQQVIAWLIGVIRFPRTHDDDEVSPFAVRTEISPV